MHILKKKREFVEKYLCWFPHKEPYVPYKIILERIFGLTSSFSNIHYVVDDNSNRYRNKVMYPMRINYSYSSEGLHVDEESNVDASRFFELLKDSDELLWDESTNHSILLIVARVFTVKFDYDSMVE